MIIESSVTPSHWPRVLSTLDLVWQKIQEPLTQDTTLVGVDRLKNSQVNHFVNVHVLYVHNLMHLLIRAVPFKSVMDGRSAMYIKIGGWGVAKAIKIQGWGAATKFEIACWGAPERIYIPWRGAEYVKTYILKRWCDKTIVGG